MNHNNTTTANAVTTVATTNVPCDICEAPFSTVRNNEHMANMDLCDYCFDKHMTYCKRGFKFTI